MLHFFRKIRRDLLVSSQFFKYLKYAIGEIILVIIGILVALFINEWNKTRLDIQFEKAILADIQKDLQQEVTYLNEWNERTRVRIKRVSMLDSLLKGETPVYNKSLDTLFGSVYGLSAHKTKNKAKYENLKSRGLNTIQVDSIREQLIFVYEQTYPYLDNSLDEELYTNENVYMPYYIPNFSNLSFQYLQPHWILNRFGKITCITI